TVPTMRPPTTPPPSRRASWPEPARATACSTAYGTVHPWYRATSGSLRYAATDGASSTVRRSITRRPVVMGVAIIGARSRADGVQVVVDGDSADAERVRHVLHGPAEQ